MFDAAREQAKANAIPRYAEPTWDELATYDEPERGSCWNCDHMVTVKLGGREYDLCVAQRDSGEFGDVWETDAATVDCQNWVEC